MRYAVATQPVGPFTVASGVMLRHALSYSHCALPRPVLIPWRGRRSARLRAGAARGLQLGGSMPPAQEQELSEAVPDGALRTTFLTAPQKNALREAVDAFWDDYGVQARHVRANRAPSALCVRPPSAAARAWRALMRCAHCVPRV